MKKTTRRFILGFGSPRFNIKVYDSIGTGDNSARLLNYLEEHNVNDVAFAGVGHINNFSEYGPVADLQLYGRSNTKKPEDIYSLSLVLKPGKQLPDEFGRACLDEIIMFGKEAELFKKLGYPKWLTAFAVRRI